ncbi:MAG: hypothetical protein ACMX3H_01030 [Sodalis sp. (in: enterobacteria)]|uniref:hypothetical protein n=1 Tax=Sodalis sp. (in: enterobacteria) TaxID=1898979 RepID=UPI0039E412D0
MTRHYFKIALFLMLSAAGLAGTAGTVASAADSGTGNASAPSVKSIDVAALNGKVTLQVPGAFVNQTREDTTSQNLGVKIQVFTDRQRQQVIGVSEVPTTAGDANDTSTDAFNKMAQGSLSGLKTQYPNIRTCRKPAKAPKSSLVVNSGAWIPVNRWKAMPCSVRKRPVEDVLNYWWVCCTRQ